MTASRELPHLIVVRSSTNEASRARVDVLRRKIAALESLAGNPGTTQAESMAAQETANKMRLELAQLLRSGAGSSASAEAFEADVEEGFETDTPRSTPRSPVENAGSGADAREADPARDTRAPRRARRRRHPVAEASTRTWVWALPVVGVFAIAGAWFWQQPHDGSRSSAAESLPVAALGAPAPIGPEAVLACKTRALLKEFRGTSGGKLMPGEKEVDLRRRCSAYLNVRGVDDGMCFPPSGDNRHPVCPIPD